MLKAPYQSRVVCHAIVLMVQQTSIGVEHVEGCVRS